MLRFTILAVVGTVTGGLSLLWLTGERWRPLRKSTWISLKSQGLKNALNFRATHAYIYGRWSKQYLKVLWNWVMPRLDEHGRRKYVQKHHGKVITHDQARAVITLNRNIPLRDLEQIIPFESARNLVLNGPPDVVVHECGCRHARAQHCEPTQVCMLIGKPFTDFVLEHHPDTSRRLSQVEALELLCQEHERGHLHSVWFKDVLMDRMYALCNCCKCCCGGIETMVKYGTPMIASSGYVAQVDVSKCEACGKCENVCPFGAVKTRDHSTVTWEKCMGCGVCVTQCPQHAVSLVRDEKKGIPFDVRVMA